MEVIEYQTGPLRVNTYLVFDETKEAFLVDPGSYRHMYLVCYYLGDDQHFVLLSKEQLDDMTLLMNNAGSRFLYTEDGVGYRW